VALVAATVKTVLQIVPAANRPVRAIELGISFDSVTSTDAPVVVELVRQSTAGTSSALTLVEDQENESASLVMTGLQTFTAEPTLGNILRTWHISPIGGLFVIQWPLDREPVALGTRLGIRCTAPQAQAATAYLVGVE
jgi:hypothetical protein